MIKFVQYHPDHLAQLEPNGLGIYTRDQAERLEVRFRSWTGMVDGKVVGCAGFLPQWDGRALAWGFFGPIKIRDWAVVIGKIKIEMAVMFCDGFRRIEATVPAHSGRACRLAQKLGFQVEGKLRRYGPQGEDHFMYARIAA